jgi:alkanesulfonate monooxygenase SsuD/methylene tetrahydromethanopterin reductase-like flavin-dependent oxidoreductase (luciferase family)
MHWDDVKGALYPDTADAEDFTHARVERLLRLVAGEPAASFSGREGVVEEWSDRVQPHSPGLRGRMWYGGASTRSAQWAGRAGVNLLTSSVVKAEDGSTGFAAIQAAQVRAYRDAGGTGRVSQGLVVIPTDGATPAQRERYATYAAERRPRTASPQGPARLLFAPDLVGSAEEIAEALYAHAGFREVTDVAFALPFSFAEADDEQILTDVATRLGPLLGWSPG